jgi:hypothetical protein
MGSKLGPRLSLFPLWLVCAEQSPALPVGHAIAWVDGLADFRVHANLVVPIWLG